MTLLHPNHDAQNRPQLPWTFPLLAGSAVVAVILMALMERVAG